MTRAGRCELTPASLPVCCATIAGLLAEHAYKSLTVEPHGIPPRPLAARQTDLPGEILRSLPCTLRADLPAQLDIRFTTAAVTWTTDDQALAECLSTSLPLALS